MSVITSFILDPNASIEAKKKEIDLLTQKIHRNCRNPPTISNETLIEILDVLSSTFKIKDNSDLYISLINHEVLERCIRNSKEYTLEKTIQIFEKHFISLNPPRSWYTKLIEFAIYERDPALLNAALNAIFKKGYQSNISDITGETLARRWKHNHEDRPDLLGKLTTLTDQCINILVQNKWNINLKGQLGDITRKLPIVYAVQYGDPTTFISLLQAKADVNIPPTINEYEVTFLHHYTSYQGGNCNNEMVKYVVKFGCPDLFVMNSKNQTAADVARENYHTSIANYLDQTKNTYINDLLQHLPRVLAKIVHEYVWRY